MDRPKRNTRKPVNLKEEEPANTETSRKRKAEAPDVPGNPAELLKTYLESSRSPLTKVDLAVRRMSATSTFLYIFRS